MLIHFSFWAALAFGLQFLLPLVVGLITTRVTSSRDQFLLLASLTVLVTIATGAVSAHDAGTPFDVVQAVLNALAGFLVSVGTHFGIWKPTGLAGLLLAVGSRAVTPDPTPSAPTPSTPAPAVTVNVTAPAADPAAVAASLAPVAARVPADPAPLATVTPLPAPEAADGAVMGSAPGADLSKAA
jgi:hypothetical protein